MPEISTHDWDEFVKARNELEAANEYHLALIDKYTSVSTPISDGRPLSVTTRHDRVKSVPELRTEHTLERRLHPCLR